MNRSSRRNYRSDPYTPPPSNGGNREQAYGDAALAAECNLVATAPEGSRNDQLFRSGCKLFELVAGGILSERQVRDALMDAAIAAGLTAVGSGKTIDSAAAHGLQHPRGPQERERTRPYTDYGADEMPPPQEAIPAIPGQPTMVVAVAELSKLSKVSNRLTCGTISSPRNCLSDFCPR